MFYRVPLVALLIVFASGCNTPQSICNDMVMSLNDLFARCGYLPIVLLLATGEETTCDRVNSVENPGQLLNECIPWAQEATCEELAAASSLEDIISRNGCDFGLLRYYPPDS